MGWEMRLWGKGRRWGWWWLGRCFIQPPRLPSGPQRLTFVPHAEHIHPIPRAPKVSTPDCIRSSVSLISSKVSNINTQPLQIRCG